MLEEIVTVVKIWPVRYHLLVHSLNSKIFLYHWHHLD
jgi:hypothetical protein